MSRLILFYVCFGVLIIDRSSGETTVLTIYICRYVCTHTLSWLDMIAKRLSKIKLNDIEILIKFHF